MPIQLRTYRKDKRKTRHPAVLESVDPIMILKYLNMMKHVTPTNNNSKLTLRDMIVKFVNFVAHFLLVMSLLYLSAFIFSHLEDGKTGCHGHEKNTNNNSNGVNNSSGVPTFLQKNDLEELHLTECDLQDIELFVNRLVEENKKKHRGRQLSKDIQKWFYFVVIASTTIGYGDVYPQTQNGKIFYCCFSIIGIILMMSLLSSCGVIMSSINKRFYRAMRKLCPWMKRWSEEFLSFVSLVFMFVFYLGWGISHHFMSETTNRSLVDIVYFWIVTFTTVGFGDLGYSLEFEIEHTYDLTVYRVFGVSLVAAIIESLQIYISFRKERLQQKKIMKKIRSSVLSSPIMCKDGIINNDGEDDEENDVFDEDVFNVIRRMTMNNLADLDLETAKSRTKSL